MSEERVPMQGLRRMGESTAEEGASAEKVRAPQRTEAEEALAARAIEVLRAEFARVLEMKEKLAAEASVGGGEKGREPSRQGEKIRGLVASLEGMSRFAMAMGILTPAENKAIWQEHVAKGLYEGWR